MVNPARFVVDFESVDVDDQHIVGDHAARLGNLKKTKALIPQGFIIPPQAYFEFISANNLDTKIAHLLGSINFTDENSINQVAKHIKRIINSSPVPADLANQIFAEHEKMGNRDVRIHTSIVSGHAGQNEFPREYFFENITGESALVDFIRNSWSSIYDPALITFRNKHDVDHLKTGISTVVQEVIFPELKGKIYTRDPEFRGKTKLVLETDAGRFILDRENGIERKHDSKSPVVFVKDGVVLENELLDKSIINSAFEIAQSLEQSFEGHEISWVKSGNNFYVYGVKPLNLYA